MAVSLGLWFWTQSLIGARGFPETCVGDGLHQLTAGVNAWLAEVPRRADALLILSSLVIDFVGVFLLAREHLRADASGPSSACWSSSPSARSMQASTALPPPEGMIWRYPGFPSLLVTYGVASDFFFSGHTAIAAWGGLEMGRLRFRGAVVLGVLIAVFEATTVIVLRAHYTMDVFTGVVVALLDPGSRRSVGAADRSGARPPGLWFASRSTTN